MKANNKLTAVAVGTDHQNTLGVIRSLGEAGIRVKAVLISDVSDCSTAHSKYIDEVFVVRNTELIGTLKTLGQHLLEKVPLIPCGDDSAIPIAKAYDELGQWYYLPKAGNGENMLRLMKKTAMLDAAQRVGLRVPSWAAIREEDFARMEQMCAHLHFPCILKPVDLKPGGIFEFRILESADKLLDSMDYIHRNCSSVIVQEYVQKTGEFGVNACRLFHSGDTVFCGVIEKKRFSQVSLGSTTAGTIGPDYHGLCEQARKFVEAIDYRGIFDMEFITDGKDFYFVEMNFRNGGYGYACTKAGRNLPAIWAREAYGASVEQEVNCPMKELLFINESADLQNVRMGNISIFRWFWDVLMAKAHMYINLQDMRPLLKKIRR